MKLVLWEKPSSQITHKYVCMYKLVISDKLMRKVKIEKALLIFMFPYKIDKNPS